MRVFNCIRFAMVAMIALCASTTKIYAVNDLDDEPVAIIDSNKIDELSGVIRAARPGEYWGINDRGNGPDIHRFTIEGELMQTVELWDAENEDWEAITRNEYGNLFIGDIGDNQIDRWEYVIYEIMEPKEDEEEVDIVQEYRFTYSDRDSHNSESMFFLNGNLYIITKEENKRDYPKLFRLNLQQRRSQFIAQDIGDMDMEGRVADAAYSSSHDLLAVLTDDDLLLFFVQEERDLFMEPIQILEMDLGNCEGVCFDRNDVIITNEKGEIWRYPIAYLLED